MKVYKYIIPMPNEHHVSTIMMPRPSEPLSVGCQSDQLVLWARTLSFVESALVETEFIVINTGVDQFPKDMPFKEKMRYWTDRFLGTVATRNGIVWHVFTIKKPRKLTSEKSINDWYEKKYNPQP